MPNASWFQASHEATTDLEVYITDHRSVGWVWEEGIGRQQQPSGSSEDIWSDTSASEASDNDEAGGGSAGGSIPAATLPLMWGVSRGDPLPAPSAEQPRQRQSSSRHAGRGALSLQWLAVPALAATCAALVAVAAPGEQGGSHRSGHVLSSLVTAAVSAQALMAATTLLEPSAAAPCAARDVAAAPPSPRQARAVARTLAHAASVGGGAWRAGACKSPCSGSRGQGAGRETPAAAVSAALATCRAARLG